VAQKVLLYGNVNSYSARQFVTELSALSGKDKEIHINGDGGEVKYGLACITNLSKADNVSLINDAQANSMFAFMFCYPAKSKKCADYSTFGFHRAAYPDWYESNPEYFDDAAKAELVKMNGDLRKAMEGTVDSLKWMQETGCSLDELFSMNGRKEVIVDAEKAKRLGLVDEVFPVTPAKRSEISALRQTIEANFYKKTPVVAEKPIQKTMITVAEFKAQNPEGYAEIITAERERCEAWAVFADVDHKAVAEGISSGKNISAKAQGEFIRKQVSAETVVKVEAENAPNLNIQAKKAEAEKTEAEKNAALIEANLRKHLKN
jgi:ATP-dependent protease ClpP protease subunit